MAGGDKPYHIFGNAGLNRRRNRKERTMAKARLLTAACAAALLAATPVLAQVGTGNAGNTGTGPANDAQAMPNQTGQTSTPSHPGWRAHRSTSRSQGAFSRQRASRDANAQNADVDRLNQQSYEAAQRGQNFSVGGSSGMSTAPSGGGNTAGGGGNM
jgi:hypothetical protein